MQTDAITRMIEEAKASAPSAFPSGVPAELTPEQKHYQVGRLSITHEAIIDWLVANPGKGQKGRCAEVFGITQAWLSTLIHSDAFQAVLREKQDVEYQLNVVPLKDKITAVAHEAVEKLGESVSLTNDPKLLLDISDKMLHRLGYAPKVGIATGDTINNTQNNTYNVSPDLLAKAREATKKGDLLDANAPKELPAPEELPAMLEHQVGTNGSESSGILVADEEGSRSEEARIDL